MAGRHLVPALDLNEAEAAKALRVFNRLKVPDMIGFPTMAEKCPEWFQKIVEALFGSYDPISNTRVIRELFCLVPKKNGKSSYGAAMMMTAMILNRRPSAEFILIAPTKEIADIAFKQASGIAAADPELAKLFHPQRHLRLITHRNSGATLQIKASDTDVITGSKAVGTFIDETHEFARKARAKDVFVELRGAMAARPDGFLIQISTQSKHEPAGVFKEELEYARKVRDGEVSAPVLPIIYELPEEIAKTTDWKDERYWGVVNPNYGRSVDPQFLRDQLQKAEIAGPESLAIFASQHLNVEIGKRLSSDGWPGAHEWDAATDETLTLESLIERCEAIVAGVDGGGSDDLFGLAFVGRERETQRWLSWCKAWCYSKAIERNKAESSRLRDFAKAGELSIVDRLGDDIEEIVGTIKRVDDAGLLAGIGMDPYGVGSIVDALNVAGIGIDRIKAVSQGFKLMGAIKTTERKLADGTLSHADQAIMSWCVGNAKVETRGNAIIVTKHVSGVAKIDPLMALFDAVALMSENPESPASVYSLDRGILVW